MIWTPADLARLNEAWYADKPLAVCDRLSGLHCQQESNHAHGTAKYRAIIRIIWGWCGGSESDGVLWDAANTSPRADRRGLPWGCNELLSLAELLKKRDTIKQDLLTDSYIASLFNRHSDELADGVKRLQRPENGSLGIF